MFALEFDTLSPISGPSSDNWLQRAPARIFPVVLMSLAHCQRHLENSFGNRDPFVRVTHSLKEIGCGLVWIKHRWIVAFTTRSQTHGAAMSLFNMFCRRCYQPGVVMKSTGRGGVSAKARYF